MEHVDLQHRKFLDRVQSVTVVVLTQNDVSEGLPSFVQEVDPIHCLV